jgi:hypothetical protein
VAAAAVLAGRGLADALEAGQGADDAGEAVDRHAGLLELLARLAYGPAMGGHLRGRAVWSSSSNFQHLHPLTSHGDGYQVP